MNVADLPCQNCYIEGQTQAALCQTCHTELDSGARLTKEQRRDLWQIAYQKTVNKLKAGNLWPNELK
jgi:hypothetical protein